MAQDSTVVELQFLEPLMLHEVVKEGNANEVRNALNNLPVDQRNEYDQTALHIACELGNHEIVTVLLSSGANVSAKDIEGIIPLIVASRHGSLACARLLIASGADVQAADNMDWTALMWASYKGHSDVVNALLNEGANVHAVVAYNMTALLWAAGRGHKTIVRMLLEKGAKVNVTDKFGSTPLIWASRRGFIDVVPILLEHRADPDAVGANGANALISAIQNGHEECVKLMLNRATVNVHHTDKNTRSALSYAAKLGKYEAILLLLNAGAYLNLADKGGQTPLIKAVKHGHLESVRALLSRFADVDIRGKKNNTALHYACELGHVTIAREILTCNPDTEAVNDYGETPLLRAVKNKNFGITKMLLEKGAKVIATDKKKDTPLHIAIRARSLRIATLLLKKPQDSRLLYQPNKAGETPYDIDASHNKSILASIYGAKNMSPETTMQDMSSQGMPQSYDLYSSALADILCEPTLTPPLTVGLYAKWGSGKSFLLKRLEMQMKDFTSANKLEPFKKPTLLSFFIVFIVSVFFGILASELTTTMRAVVGTIVGCLIFFGYSLVIAVTAIGASFGKWEWSVSLWKIIQNQYSYIKLLFKLWFMVPPSVKQTTDGKAIPVRFLFTNYSRLTSVGGETSLAEMIGLLSCSAEKDLGFLAVRLYRAFRHDLQDRGSKARYKKMCCVPYCAIAVFFFLSVAALILLALSAYGPAPTLFKSTSLERNVTETFSVIDGSMLVIGTLDLAVLFIAAPTLVAMGGALIWSQRKRVLTAAHHTKSQERLMQQLKQEVDILRYTVIAIDAFRNTQTRMCVTINGLDSCEQDKVLQVLDTVHILFSQRPYITILAIDPFIISKAIQSSLNSAFRDANINGYDYLRNVIHLPFYLKDRTRTLERLTANTDLDDGQNDHDSDHDATAQSVTENSPKKSPLTSRPASFSRRPNGIRRSIKSIDLGKLMFSEDWFNSMSPQVMKRILHIVSLTGRFLRAEGVDFSWGKLAAWINLTEQWPCRTSFLLYILEKSEEAFGQRELLRNVYERNDQYLPSNDPSLEIDSSDDRSFRAFLSARSLTVRDVGDFFPSTVNLDPQLLISLNQDPYKNTQGGMKNSFSFRDPPDSSELHKAETLSLQPTIMTTVTSQSLASTPYTLAATPFTLATTPYALPAAPYTLPAAPYTLAELEELSIEDVANRIYEIRGLSLENVEKYASFVRMNNINGAVMLACDLDDLKKELFAPFGDWCLIKQWIVRMRSGLQDDGPGVHAITNLQRLHDQNQAGCHDSTTSLEFQTLQGTDRVAYDNAFKDYLRLHPDTNGAEHKFDSDSAGEEDALRSSARTNKRIDDTQEMTQRHAGGGETSPLLILHS